MPQVHLGPVGTFTATVPTDVAVTFFGQRRDLQFNQSAARTFTGVLSRPGDAPAVVPGQAEWPVDGAEAGPPALVTSCQRVPALPMHCRGARRVFDPPAADRLQPPRPEEVGFSVRRYELMVILDPDLEERTIAPSLDRFLTVVTKSGGTVKTEIWGRRRMAYEIKKQVEGIYAIVNIEAEPAAVAELDRQLNLNESVLRTKLMRPEVH